MVQLSHLYMTPGNPIALTVLAFVSKVMSLLFNILSRLVITFLPRSKRLLNSWLQSPSAVILELKKVKSFAVGRYIKFKKEKMTHYISLKILSTKFSNVILKNICIYYMLRSISTCESTAEFMWRKKSCD